jgi:hypothetical protein
MTLSDIFSYSKGQLHQYIVLNIFLLTHELYLHIYVLFLLAVTDTSFLTYYERLLTSSLLLSLCASHN